MLNLSYTVKEEFISEGKICKNNTQLFQFYFLQQLKFLQFINFGQFNLTFTFLRVSKPPNRNFSSPEKNLFEHRIAMLCFYWKLFTDLVYMKVHTVPIYWKRWKNRSWIIQKEGCAFVKDLRWKYMIFLIRNLFIRNIHIESYVIALILISNKHF